MRARKSAVLLLALLAAACARAPRLSEPFAGPFAAPEKPVERGRVVYLQNCYRCHQDSGEGGLGPPITSRLARATLKLELRHGFGAMPAFDETRMSDLQLDDLNAYWDALRRPRTVAGGEAAE